MKKINLLAIFMTIILTFSCNKQDEEVIIDLNGKKSIEGLINDPSFLGMMNSISQKNLYEVDLNVALELTSRNHLTDQEIIDLSNALGFSDKKDMLTFLNDQLEFSKDIEEKYGISGYDIEYVKNTLLNENSKSNGCIDRCQRRSENCVIAATATAVVAHLGCVTLDITVVAGVICHGAVATAQYIDNSNCRLDLEDCLEDCRNSQ